MDIVRQPKTNTTKFVLPLLFDKDVRHTNILTENFKDTYVADIDKQEVDDYILAGNVETFDTMEDFLRTLRE